LILDGSISEVILAAAFTALGLVAVSAALEGYSLRALTKFERIIFLLSGIMMMSPGHAARLSAFVVASFLLLFQVQQRKRLLKASGTGLDATCRAGRGDGK